VKHSFLTAIAAAALFSVAGNMKGADGTPTPSPAEAYCEQSGGKVIDRAPVYNTNGPPSSWLVLAGTRRFCEFESKKDGSISTIHILVETLYTTKPSLAAAAYYAKVPPNEGGGGNPASYYCSQLGGSDQFGGVNAAGGGWVGKDGVYTVLEACIFPDMSSIDSWGLTYNAVGVIRGIDLTTVLRWAGPPPATTP
jgi:putative hemolysin